VVRGRRVARIIRAVMWSRVFVSLLCVSLTIVMIVVMSMIFMMPMIVMMVIVVWTPLMMMIFV